MHFHLKEKQREKFNLAWIAGCFFFTNALYDLAFRNASYIHDYASFYFVVPAAIMTGAGLYSVSMWVMKKYPAINPLGTIIAASLVLVALGYHGWRSAQNLRSQALVLDTLQAEPRDLIPELGRLIRREFPEETLILANFDRYYTPQLYYYARTSLANGLMDGDDWDYYISNSQDKLGGIIWLVIKTQQTFSPISNPAKRTSSMCRALISASGNPRRNRGWHKRIDPAAFQPFTISPPFGCKTWPVM